MDSRFICDACDEPIMNHTSQEINDCDYELEVLEEEEEDAT